MLDRVRVKRAIQNILHKEGAVAGNFLLATLKKGLAPEIEEEYRRRLAGMPKEAQIQKSAQLDQREQAKKAVEELDFEDIRTLLNEVAEQLL